MSIFANEMTIFPIAYFPPIPWFAAAIREKDIILEVCQHFRKQQYTNRMQIKGPNRIMPLTVPVGRKGAKLPIKEKKISYSENWQRQHWRSLIAAYKGSPYFEFYDHKMEPLFAQEFESLIDLNVATIKTCLDILGIEIEMSFSRSFEESETYNQDFRNDFDPSLKTLPDWFNTIPYVQVFDGFTPGLSILDLIFNLGPESRLLLKKSFIL